MRLSRPCYDKPWRCPGLGRRRDALRTSRLERRRVLVEGEDGVLRDVVILA